MLINRIWTVGIVICIAGLICGACLALRETMVATFGRKARATLDGKPLPHVIGDEKASDLNAGDVDPRPAFEATLTPEPIPAYQEVLAA